MKSLREQLIEAGSLIPADQEYPNPFYRFDYMVKYDQQRLRPTMSAEACRRTRATLIKNGMIKPHIPMGNFH